MYDNKRFKTNRTVQAVNLIKNNLTVLPFGIWHTSNIQIIEGAKLYFEELWHYWPTKGCSLNAKESCLIHINTLAETTERFFPASRFNYTFTHRPSYTRQASADSVFHQQSPGQNTQWAWIGLNLFRNQVVSKIDWNYWNQFVHCHSSQKRVYLLII